MKDSKYTTKEELENEKEQLIKAINTEGKNQIPPSKIVKNCIYAIIIIFLLAILSSVLISKLAGDIPNVFGIYIFQVETASMEPTLSEGTVIISINPSSEKNVNVGDIVTFKTTKGQIVTHRIVEKVADGYFTKGDNPKNSIDDEVLTFNRIISVMKLKF
ncbi:MAG: signal peptidase I [Clostridia bacterium]